MAVLLPVLLLAGLAKKLFAPLALTVAVAMIAVATSSACCVTPVACRYFLGHAEPGRLGEARRARASTASPTATRASLRARAAVPRGWSSARALVLVGASVWVAARLPSTFFPEIDESMERVYVRLAPGTSLEDAARKIDEMGEPLAQRAAARATSSSCSPTSARPSNARSAMTSPNCGPAHGLHPPGARRRPSSASSSQREIADRMREILDARLSRASSSCSGRAASSRASSRTATSRRSSSRCAATTSRSSTSKSQRGRRGRAHRARRARRLPVAPDRLPRDPRRDRPRRRPALVGVTRARRRADDARGDARQHQHAERLDRRPQRPVVLRRHLLRRHASSTIRTRSRELPVRVGDDGERGHARRLRHDPPLGRARSRSSATSSSASRTSSCRPRGATSAARRASSKQTLRARSADRATSTFDFVGQVELMRTTFSGSASRSASR